MGFDMEYLMLGAKHHNITPDDPVLKEYGAKLMREQRSAQMKQQLAGSKLDEQIANDLKAEIEAFGKVEYNQDGTIEWEQFLAISKIIAKYTFKQTQKKVKEATEERRELLRDPAKEKEYAATSAKAFAWKKGTKMIVSAHVFGPLKIPKTVLQKTLMDFQKNPEKRKLYETAMSATKTELMD